MKRIVDANGQILYIKAELIEALRTNASDSLVYVFTAGDQNDPYTVNLPIDQLAEQLGFVRPTVSTITVETDAGTFEVTAMPSVWKCPSCGGIISNEDYQARVKSPSNLFDTSPLNLCAMCHTPLSQFKEIK